MGLVGELGAEVALSKYQGPGARDQGSARAQAVLASLESPGNGGNYPAALAMLASVM